MNLKLGIMLLFSLTTCRGTPEKVIQLLDELDTAQAYWESMARDKKQGLWKRPPHKWFTTQWHQEVAQHRLSLATKRAELIEFLADYSDADRACAKKEVAQVTRTTKQTLLANGVPSHFNRRWLSYAAAGASAIGLIVYLQKFKNSHALFIIPPNTPSLASSLHDSQPFLGHDYVQQNGIQYLQVKKADEQKAKLFLEQKKSPFQESRPRLSLCWYTETGEHKIHEFIRKHGIEPVQQIYKILRNEDSSKSILTTDIDFDKNQYEQQLVIVLKNAQKIEQTAPLVHQHLNGRMVEQLSFEEKRNVFTALLFSLGNLVPEEIKTSIDELYKQTNITTSSGAESPAGTHANAAANGKSWYQKRPWDKAQQDVVENIETLTDKVDNLLHPESKKPPKSIKDISHISYVPNGVNDAIDDLNVLVPKADKLFDKADTLLDEFQSGLGSGKSLLTYVNTLVEKNTGLAALIVQIIITNAFEIKLKGAALGHEINTFAQRSKLNVELSATIPLMLAGYATYKATRTLFKYATAVTVIQPLKKDLLSLQLLLNKERYSKEQARLSKSFKGECVYLLARLARYKDSLPATYRGRYRYYLDNLGNPTLTPRQKMTVVSALFNELDPLFKKE